MADDNEELRRQMAELQTQAAFQEAALGELDRAVARQQRDILLLQRQLALLIERQNALPAREDDDNSAARANEKPPHY